MPASTDVVLNTSPPTRKPNQHERAQARQRFGTHLYQEREGSGYDQEGLAKAAGVDPHLIIDLELGHPTLGKCTVSMLNKIAEALGRDLTSIDNLEQECHCHRMTETMDQLIERGIFPRFIPI